MGWVRALIVAGVALLVAWGGAAAAGEPKPAEVLFRNVRVFDGTSPRLSAPTDVLVRGNRIARIAPGQVAAADAQVIEGRGRTLMPGLIDAHVHMHFTSMTMKSLMAPDLTPAQADEMAARAAGEMLMRGFTAVRDVGGPVFALKAGIDSGRWQGPRIWPSGPTVSQTAGHGDYRLPSEGPRRFTGQMSRAERFGAGWIADGRDEVLTAVRENLRFGASQIKLMAGGGTSSEYDPVDVSQYTFDELKAAVEAAEDWNSYVTVHAYTDRAIRRAIEAGVRCIEHGQMASEETLALMRDRGVWLSLQVLRPTTADMSPLRAEKRRPVIEGQPRVFEAAKRLGVKLAWGTDFLFEPALNREQNANLLALKQWFTPPEILKLVTHDNAQLLALSGPRSPYKGELGVVREGALADLLLVNGDPIANIDLLADPEHNFALIMKDGRIYKNGA